jgi:hypothetical protein
MAELQAGRFLTRSPAALQLESGRHCGKIAISVTE